MGDNRRAERPIGSTAKRSIDIVASLFLLVLLSPILAALAIAIKVEDGRSVLYRANRVGRGGREFRMLKFSKMREDAGGPPLTLSSDPRMTRVGRFLASSKLDEILQLWNVLKGDMSLVGPRPEDRAFVELLPKQYATILSVRPGITGLSQLAFARESEILDRDDRIKDYVDRLLPQKAALDEFYVDRWTLRLDLRILMWTAAAVLLRKNVAVNRTTGEMRARRRAPEDGTATVSSTAEGKA